MTGNARAFLAAVALSAAALPLPATIQRTFVSTSGLDSNTCARDQPCRNFAAAIAQTTPGGEVVVLDSGGYGAIPTPITSSVSIIAPLGVHAAMTVFSGNGITINGPGASVVLRNLYLNGLGGDTGIAVDDVTSLVVERSFISGFSGPGIGFNAATTGARLMLADSVSRNNGGSGLSIALNSAHATVARSRFEGNANVGVSVRSGAQANIRDSIAEANALYGFAARSDLSADAAVLELEGCTAVRNLFGILAKTETGSGIVHVSNCSITANTTGLATLGAASILSRQNNTVEDNGTDGTFTGIHTGK